MERIEDSEWERVMLGMYTVGKMNGGSSSLGSNPVVNAVVVVADGISVSVVIATGTQIAKEMKRKVVSSETFMFFFSDFFDFSFFSCESR